MRCWPGPRGVGAGFRFIAVLAGAWLAGAAAPAWAQADAPLALRELAPGVYLHQGSLGAWAENGQADVANLGVVVGERCVAVIDTGGSPAVGRALRAAIARLTPKPVCYVINTHAHPDHLLGNSGFFGSGPGGVDPQFVAHGHFAAALAARSRSFLGSLQREIDPGSGAEALVQSSMAVDLARELDLGGRRLRLMAWPTAHTDSDLSVLDLGTRTAFLGDLWFVSHLPVVDGSLRGWLKQMDTLRALDLALAVPGHGAPSSDWPAALQAQSDYLNGLARDVRAALKAHLTIQQAVAGVGVDAGPWQLTEQFHRRNVTAAFAELEWDE